MEDQIDKGGVASSSSRGSGGSGALSAADFSLFRAMIREEREAARAEREVAAERARVDREAAAERARAEREAVAERTRVDREAAAAEHLRLMIEVFELKLQLALGNGNQSGVVGGKPWTTSGLRGERRSPVSSAARRGAAAGDERITIPDGTTMPVWKAGSESAENPPSTLHSEAPTNSSGE